MEIKFTLLGLELLDQRKKKMKKREKKKGREMGRVLEAKNEFN